MSNVISFEDRKERLRLESEGARDSIFGAMSEAERRNDLVATFLEISDATFMEEFYVESEDELPDVVRDVVSCILESMSAAELFSPEERTLLERMCVARVTSAICERKLLT